MPACAAVRALVRERMRRWAARLARPVPETPAAATLMRAGGGQALDGGSMPEPWTKKSHHPFIKERTLGFHVFDGNDAKQRWVTFRAKLSDVLALPSD